MINKRIPRFALFIGSLFSSLLIAEVALRIISTRDVNVRFLATAGTQTNAPLFDSLEQYLESKKPHIETHRAWLNYYANERGFYDQEFSTTKAPDEFRIAALGDSYCYGLVSYPLNVQTLVENKLKERCAKNISVYNFGIPASGVWDYRMLFDFTVREYDIDTVVIHFYLGNDAPDLLHHFDDLPKWKSSLAHLYLPTYVSNAIHLWNLTKKNNPSRAAADHAQGGYPIDVESTPHAAESHYSLEGYHRVLEDEMGRFYRADQKELKKRWHRVFEVLRLISDKAKSENKRLLILLYPSRLQIEDQSREEALRTLRKRLPEVRPDDFEMDLPSKMMIDFCAHEQLSCFDLTENLKSASLRDTTPFYIANDVHWNAAGNRSAAEIESDFLALALCPAADT